MDGSSRRRIGWTAVACVILLGVVLAVGQVSGFLQVLPPTPRTEAVRALDVMEANGIAVDERTWPAVRAAAEAEIDRAPDAAATYPALTRALAAAGGEHSRFFPAGTSLADTDGGRPPAMPVVATEQGVTTVALPALVSEDPAVQQRYADAAAAGLADADAASCGWIVDLRGNTGGTMWPMLAGVSPLLPGGPAMAFVDRSGARTDVVVEGGRVSTGGQVKAEAAHPRLRPRPVAVLQDGRTASSGEAVLLAFRGVADVRSFGAPSAGYSSSNVTVPVGDASMLLTTARDADRTGRVWGGVVPPDRAAVPADTAARAWLAQRRCGGR